MENLADPGISITFICLAKANVELGNLEAKQDYRLELVGFERSVSPDGKFLDTLASFDLMHEIPDPLFRLTCSFIARYQRSGEEGLPWDKFTPAMALAHLIPYLREFVSNTTNRLLVPVLILKPINAYHMFADFASRAQKDKHSSAEVVAKE